MGGADSNDVYKRLTYLLTKETEAVTNALITCEIQEALLMQRNSASTMSVEIVYNAAQMFNGLHLKRPATGERPSKSFKVIQGHCRGCHSIGHILFPIRLPL